MEKVALFVLFVIIVIVVSTLYRIFKKEDVKNLKENQYGLKFKSDYRTEDSRYLGFYDEKRREIIWLMRNHTSLSYHPKFIREWFSIGTWGIGASMEHTVNSFRNIEQVYEYNERELHNYNRSVESYNERKRRMNELHNKY